MTKKNPKFEYTALYTALHVANSFVKMGVQRANPVDLLRLVKYVYFAKGWHSALHNEYLFAEKVQAWKYGPVVPSVYYAFKRKFSGPILKPESEYNFEDGSQWVGHIRADDQKARQTLDTVWVLYERDSSTSLINLTHAEGTPWKEHYDGGLYKEIPDEDIARHFKKKKDEYIGAVRQAKQREAKVEQA